MSDFSFFPVVFYLIAAITVVDVPQEKKFLVVAEGAIDKPANLALWFERGTVHMAARPFMRPAAV